MTTYRSRRIFVSFADAKYEPSLRRIAAQAEAMNVYDDICPRRERDLPDSFVRRHRGLLRPGVRGFGYYVWKPQIVYDALEQCRNGDIVQWCDAGCHLQPAGRSRLHEYFALAESSASGILAFKFSPPVPPFRHDGRPLLNCKNVEWCKSDVLAHYDLLEDKAFLEDFQVVTTTFFIRKTDATMAIVRQWRNDSDGDVSLFDDSPSRLPNSPRFIEHRHDQSVFSCLAWRHGCESISACEVDYPHLAGESRPCQIVANYPVCAMRDKKYSLRFRAVRKMRRLWSTYFGDRGRG